MDCTFVVSKAKSAMGGGDILEYSLDPVRDDELEDWGAVAITDEQLDEFAKEAYTAALVPVKSKQELTQIAEQYWTVD